METKKINQPGTVSANGRKHGKLDSNAAVGAAAVAGVAAGAVGMETMNEHNPEDSAVEKETMVVQPKENSKQPETETTEPETGTMEQDVVDVEPEFISTEPESVAMETEAIQEEDILPEPEVETVVSQEPVIVEDVAESVISQTATTDDTDTYNEEQSDYNLVDEIITGEEIDPNDVDMADVINVDSVGTVYTVDGQSLPAAAIHDDDGNELLIVDVDGDGVFDVVTTAEGDVVAEIGGDIDVSDAEHMMTDEAGGYLAANDFDESLDVGSDIEDDIIEV